ncbi:hypothetical protein J4E83_004439 [Alternaria metachromatica]|uniref:uncharacterized protein n=1 Tax=Alternaria metachromatica TaxID=283354 RepID=UPI0020C5562A|nr:uncharacterized protein J4E83_004439 [Alternaria metachromatica]KAI4624763.1 hypothetical protein J4E83_004439 [Alternaria metachromatica]
MPYRWDSFPVSFVVNEEEAALGEMLINGLALGYIESGFGVAGHPAGLNVNSAIQAKTENWDDAIAFRFRYTCYKHNMVKEGERVSKIPAGELLIKKARLETINQLQDDIKSNIPDVLEIRSRLAKVTLSGEDQASETLRRFFDSIQQRSNLLLNRMEEDLQNMEKG